MSFTSSYIYEHLCPFTGIARCPDCKGETECLKRRCVDD
jgi:hypothetical protein